MIQMSVLHTDHRDEPRYERLREVIPVAVAVAGLVGVTVAGSLALRSLLDFGVWLISST
jgi:hypothetical protein